LSETVKIVDLPVNERPREKLLQFGGEVLSNSELLAVILRSGNKKENVITLCSRLLSDFQGLNGLLTRAPEELMELEGIGTAKATQLLALAELCKRVKAFKSGEEHKITQPKEAADLVMESMRCLKQEYLKVIMLNTKNTVIAVRDVSVGTLNSSLVHPREVFCEPLKRNSASIIICHNHPSGDPNPSSEDINITNRLKESGKLIGVELLDHLIIGDGKYISLKEKGLL